MSRATNAVPGQTDDNGANDVFLYDRAAGSLELVSHAAGSALAAGNRMSGPALSIAPDGGWVAYDSRADNLTGSVDANLDLDVFLYDRQDGTSALASPRGGLASDTAPGSTSYWAATAMSNDGRYVVFQSEASNLTAGTDTNGQLDIFLRDRMTGTTTLVSHAAGSAGTAASGGSLYPAVSTDGNAVVFISRGTDLVAGQVTNFEYNLFHWDRRTGTVALVNHSASSPVVTGNTGLYGSSRYVLSGDGRWVAYSSADSDLVAGNDPNGNLDVFLFDSATGTNTLVSRSASSPTQAGDDFSYDPAISADGRWIAFASLASNLVPGQVGDGGIFLYDRQTGTTIRVSRDGFGAEISADGLWIAFTSGALDLIPGQVDPNGTSLDVFLWDRVSGTTTLVSRSAFSAVTTGSSGSTFGSFSENNGVLSADGRYLVFASQATDLVPGQVEGNTMASDVFLFDRVTGGITLVSRSAASAQTTGNQASNEPVISADGSRVAFVSRASNLISPVYDPFGDEDFFVYDRASGTTTLASHKPSIPWHGGDFAAFLNEPLSVRISADGRVVAFSSEDPSLVFRDLDGQTGAFVHVEPLPGRDFFTAVPCRVLDTRQQGPALSSGVERTFQVTGGCGIPATARAVAINISIVQPSGGGFVVLHPGDLAAPLTSTVNFAAGAVRANNAILALAFDGTGTLAATPSVTGGGTAHLIVDVSGWFE